MKLQWITGDHHAHCDTSLVRMRVEVDWPHSDAGAPPRYEARISTLNLDTLDSAGAIETIADAQAWCEAVYTILLRHELGKML